MSDVTARDVTACRDKDAATRIHRQLSPTKAYPRPALAEREEP